MNTRTKITLRHAEAEDRTIWVTESESIVRGMIQLSTEYVTFSRVVGLMARSFTTRRDNILNVEDVSA